MSTEMNAQDRVVAIVELLAKAGREGMANKDVMLALKLTAATASRDLALLEAAGWVERDYRRNARLSAHFGGFANQIAKSFQERVCA